ncbi:TPA: hypothetical protein ACONTJ_005726, partial [Escherichia coli]
PQPPRLSPGGHIPDYFLRFSPIVMPVKVARCFHDHTGWFNNIRRNILMAIPGSEIIAIMLANFLLFKPASEDILP